MGNRRALNPWLDFHNTRDVSAILNPFVSFPPAVGGGNGLLTGLKAYWKLDEASGGRADSVGSNHLSDFNGVTSGAGLISDAAQFDGSVPQWLRVLDNDDVSVGAGRSFTVSCWVYPTLVNGAFHAIFGCTGIADDYALFIWNNDEFRLAVNGGANAMNSGATVSVNNWYHLVFRFDVATGTLSLIVNNGTPVNVTGVTSVADHIEHLYLGTYGAGSYNFTGRISQMGIWHRALSAGDVTFLNGGGTPPPFSTFD